MASPRIKKSSNHSNKLLPGQIQRLPLVTRRCAAWVVEISLIAASALVPYSIGLYVNDRSAATVPLNPVVATTTEALAKALALPWRHLSQRKVAPITNLLWCGAIIAPLVVAGWQMYKLAKTGQTPSKGWFGVQVVKASGAPPGWGRILIRSGVGLLGLPVGVAYLIWRVTGAFPDLGILTGLVGLMLLGESATLWLTGDRRTLHDRLAGTRAIDTFTNTIPYQGISLKPLWEDEPVTLEVTSTWSQSDETGETIQCNEQVTTIVLTPKRRWPQWRLWDWMRQRPGMTLLIVALAGMTLVLGTFVGTQVYIQNQANRRILKQNNSLLFLALIKQLSSEDGNTTQDRRPVIVALATLDDPHVVPFLVNLLSQEKTPELMGTIEQSIVSVGPVALPDLQKLNQSLTNDSNRLPSSSTSEEKQLIALRLRATQEALAKILTIYNPEVHKADLSHVNLSSVNSGLAPFNLVLDKADLSGINFKGAILTNASLRESRFHGVGDDGRFGTFDDWAADLSGADLKQANLTGAILSNIALNRSNLIRATLNRSNLSEAHLTGANLSGAQLVGADLHEAVLENATLIGANLADANFSKSDLQGARLGQSNAVGTQLPSAMLVQSDWQGADLSAANLGGANLENANLSSTKLVGTNLSNAQLQNADLRNADLSQADLRGANLAGADFQAATLIPSLSANSGQFIQGPPTAATATHVKGVDFSQVKNLERKEIAYICSQGGRHPLCR